MLLKSGIGMLSSKVPILRVNLILLAVIYILQISFSNAMANDDALRHHSAQGICYHNHSKNIPHSELSYRLLSKHDRLREIQTNLPNSLGIAPSSFNFFIERHFQYSSLNELRPLSVPAFRLYLLFRVFLIWFYWIVSEQLFRCLAGMLLHSLSCFVIRHDYGLVLCSVRSNRFLKRVRGAGHT